MTPSGFERYLHILADPNTGDPLSYDNGRLTSATSSWPIVDGSPWFLEEQAAEPREYGVSHALASQAEILIQESTGWVLNLSAGGTSLKAKNVIELEQSLYSNTDVAADAHHLPFIDESLTGVVCLNAFEHYADPWQVAREIERILAPGGWCYVLTAFMQPGHMLPHHYFNATPEGVRLWFSSLEIDRCGGTEFHNGVLSLQWLAKTLMWAIQESGGDDSLGDLTVSELATAWEAGWSDKMKIAHDSVAQLPAGLRDLTAQSVELLARKP